MKLRQMRYLFLSLGIVLILMSACSSITGAPGSSQTALQVLQKSVTAMKGLKTVHFGMNMSETLNMSNSAASSSSGVPSHFNFAFTASGDEILPDQVSMQMSTSTSTSSAANIKLGEIVTGGKVYIQNSKGQWFILSEDQYKSSAGALPFANTNISSFNNLLSLAQKATFTDHGDQTLNGQSLRHITVTLSKNSLLDLLNTTGALNKLSAQQQQSMDKLLNAIQLQNASLDLWVDESTDYVHQMGIKMVMNINTASLVPSTTSSSSTSSNVSAAIDMTINYSNFNAPITIKAPANATPANNILSIFE